jgi:hypothetical protein
MPTPPDFTNGTPLDASSLNSIGLWLVKTVTIGNGVSSVPVNDAFSSAWENYKIIISMNNNSSGGGNSMLLQLNGITSNSYYTIGTFAAWATSISQLIGSPINSWPIGFPFAGLHNSCDVEIFSPFRSDARTTAKSGMSAPAYASDYSHQVTTTASTTGFSLSIAAGGTFTGGSIYVYGYNS